MSIETEILELTGLKGQKKKETEQAYLKRVLLAIDKVDDEKFFALSEETQKWVDDAIDAVEEKEEISSFIPDEDEDEDEDENGDEDEDENGEDDDEDEDEDEDENGEDEDKKENKSMSKKQKKKEKDTKTRRKSSTTTEEKKKDKKSRKSKAAKERASTSTKKKGKGKSKTKEASSGVKGRGRPSANAGKKIKVLERKPPLKAGSKRAEMFSAMKKAKTVANYTDAGGTAKFLSVAEEKGWIKLV